MHISGSNHLRPFVRSLLKAFDNEDPARNQQRAITPKLLRAMYTMAGADAETTRDSELAIVADLAIMGYFYAMRSCEFTQTPQRGRTKLIRLSGIVFRDANNVEMDNRDCRMRADAERVTITFENQKNGLKMDRRTHQRSGDPVLCPVKRIAALVDRILRTVPSANADTPINAVYLSGTLHQQISSTTVRNFMRSTCTAKGGKQVFGFDALDIGTKSIRSGAAMGLFLMNIPTQKIKMMGRWSSDAFLVYIRPQVLEWTNDLSRNMIQINSFTDVHESRPTLLLDPQPSATLFNGNYPRHVDIRSMHLHH